jgi:hypothetical protein
MTKGVEKDVVREYLNGELLRKGSWANELASGGGGKVRTLYLF